MLHLVQHSTKNLFCILIHLQHSTEPKNYHFEIRIFQLLSLPEGFLAISCCVIPSPGRNSRSNEYEWQTIGNSFCWKQRKKRLIRTTGRYPLTFHLILYLCQGCLCVWPWISFEPPITDMKSHLWISPMDIDLDSSVY
jgi:hypothetical protein